MGRTLLSIYRGEGPAGLFKWAPHPPAAPSIRRHPADAGCAWSLGVWNTVTVASHMAAVRRTAAAGKQLR